ncbi:MAG TPA: hypothetical protein VGX25_20225 [Actinophytocola sp.]|uniref:hypothetical protein n=1 Tax=Actinophytocola sp. TaxID=1872138 RepID=UPI002DDDA62E|nr:hypothetical protein [Actinophytocola sp.]HEV2781718.1 hypothetical protein [Actinophytocola sp.]
MSSDKSFLNRIAGWLIAALGVILLNLSFELLGDRVNDTAIGRLVGYILFVAVVAGLPLGLVALAVHYLWGRKLLGRKAKPPEREPVKRREPPAWQRPKPLQHRKSEVDNAVRLLLDNGFVAVIGARDVGTSAVAASVVQRLLDERRAGRATRIDMRSRSSRRPDTARDAAGRVLSTFGLDEPADGSPERLADASERLERALRSSHDVLLLDNVSAPEEVEWLTDRWPVAGRPWLVIAGESAVRPAVHRSVEVLGELSRHGLRAIWEAEVGPAGTPWWRRLRELLAGRGRAGRLDPLLDVCGGLPGVLMAFVREMMRPGSTLTVEALRSGGVWTVYLNHVRAGLSADAVWLLHALAELPVTALSAGEIAALLETTGDPLEELRIRNLVRETDDGRYRLPIELREVLTTPRSDRRRYAHEAVPALVRHHARETALWLPRLGTTPVAVEWFHDAELSLRPLFTTDGYPDDDLVKQVIDDLAAIADALEAWYVREQQSGGLFTVSQALRDLAERAGRTDLAGLAAVRMAAASRIAAALDEAGQRLDAAARYVDRLPAEAAAGLRVRIRIERALLALAGPGRADPDRLAAAERELDRVADAQSGHPELTIVRLNLGALCLGRQRWREALEHLDRARGLAAEQRDTGCEAHAVELQGVALAAGDLPEAVHRWLRAKEWYERTGDEQGEARCLQHLGSAALTDATAAGQIRDGRPAALTPPEAARVALSLLEKAKSLRAGQPDTSLVDHYLSVARQRLGKS